MLRDAQGRQVVPVDIRSWILEIVVALAAAAKNQDASVCLCPALVLKVCSEIQQRGRPSESPLWDFSSRHGGGGGRIGGRREARRGRGRPPTLRFGSALIPFKLLLTVIVPITWTYGAGLYVYEAPLHIARSLVSHSVVLVLAFQREGSEMRSLHLSCGRRARSPKRACTFSLSHEALDGCVAGSALVRVIVVLQATMSMASL